METLKVSKFQKENIFKSMCLYILLWHFLVYLLLYRCLDEICKSGESATEFLSLFKRLISQPHWKCYLSIKGVLLHLGDLINKVCVINGRKSFHVRVTNTGFFHYIFDFHLQEVEQLQFLEETTLSSDLAQGFALKALTGIKKKNRVATDSK